MMSFLGKYWKNILFLLVLFVASGSFWSSCHRGKLAEKLQTELKNSDSILARVTVRAVKAEQRSQVVDLVNDTLTRRSDSLFRVTQLGKKETLKTRTRLTTDSTLKDSVVTLLEVVHGQDTTILRDSLHIATLYDRIALLGSDRDSLRLVVDSIPAKMEAIRKINQSVAKGINKLKGEPFLDFDIGVGFSVIPDLKHLTDLKKWHSGPSINATFSLHP